MPTPPSPIAYIDLKTQQGLIRKQVEQRFTAILDHGAYINGPEVKELEDALCAYTGAKKALAIGNGTDALIVPMMAMDLKADDAVFIPAFTYNATCSAVMIAGATPVFVDVRARDFSMDPADLEKQIAAAKARGLNPRLIIAVDLFGIPADYEAIFAIAETHGLQVMADAAQSFGCRWKGKYAGAIAPVTGTSFFPAKSLGCYGDGGAIMFADESLYEACEQIRWHGTDANRKESVRVGFNGRLDSIQCAIVTEKLKLFPGELARRHEIAAVYNEKLAGAFDAQDFGPDRDSGWGYYTVAIDDRDGVQAKLKDDGVPTAIYYPQPLHTMKAFKHLAPEGGCPEAERLTARVLSLPLHPYMTDAQVDYVVERFLAAVGR
ncbi:DegT/DnrJ/EryC1/StrS aminotransferase family protein [Caulobacter sp. 17J80-11]|uniref:DegT/DnrJ/EryC1/StrS family aminotransferase n=1 Tax=Caulobacter sp. 17J80-11 TaxID=2763502 RepID=UPI001653BC11|nr:DegT/DnrJ/EryC1/StrS family aminotransferase [Caulobacter sp. 17J80-11]MBC6981738.1 DegT/DnrJ/EryC1/StrS family aminotransferase [Caulobacter sp. 17J80-11]